MIQPQAETTTQSCRSKGIGRQGAGPFLSDSCVSALCPVALRGRHPGCDVPRQGALVSSISISVSISISISN